MLFYLLLNTVCYCYLGFVQVVCFVSHLGARSVSGIQALLHLFHPADKLPHVVLVAGPLGQGTLQLTLALDGGREQRVPGVLKLLDLQADGGDALGRGVPLYRLTTCHQHLQLNLLLLPGCQQGLQGPQHSRAQKRN